MGSVNPKMARSSAPSSFAVPLGEKPPTPVVVGAKGQVKAEETVKWQPTAFQDETNEVLIKAVIVSFDKTRVETELPPYANLLVEELKKFNNIQSSTVSNMLEFLDHFTLASVRGRELAEKWRSSLGRSDYAVWITQIWPNLFEPNPFQDATDKGYVRTFGRVFHILWNSTDDSVEMCEKVAANGLITSLVNMAKRQEFQPDAVEHSVSVLNGLHFITSIIHNCMRNNFEETKRQFRAADGVKTLTPYLSESFVKMRGIQSKVSMVLAYGINEDEIHILSASENVLKFIVERLLKSALNCANHRSSLYGFSAEETIAALNAIAVNDNNKLAIVQLGALDYYMKAINMYQTEIELVTATKGFWILSFKKENHGKIKEIEGALTKMEDLQYFNNEEVQRAAEGVLWNIKGPTVKSETKEKSDKTGYKEPSNHIMLSYCWAHKPLVTMINFQLKAAGYETWMDDDKMSGSTLESMARAIENSQVVLVFFSENYKNSPSCRTEAEYAYRLRKPIVPVRMQPKYMADGWLGILLGTKLYFDCPATETVASATERIMKELDGRGKRGAHSEEGGQLFKLGGKISIRYGDLHLSYDPLSLEVQEWLKASDLQFLVDKMVDYDGQLLTELYLMSQRAPTIFYASLKEDLAIATLTEVLRFTQKLSALHSTNTFN